MKPIKAILGLSILLSSTAAFSSNVTIYKAIRIGAIEITRYSTPQISSDLEELINQINKYQNTYDEPVLIFEGDECIVNNPELLEEILQTASATLTSI